ncbi:MAG: transketolase, partial [Limnochordia bacterium]
GMAAALRRKQDADIVPNVYVLLGDGELQEGSNWEAIMLASHLQLGNLIAIIDHNGLQQGAAVDETVTLGDLGAKFASFGWDVRTVDGHDHAALLQTLQRSDRSRGQPRAVIAKTIKGRGVSFMENDPKWHHKIPTESEYQAARAELLRTLEGRNDRG